MKPIFNEGHFLREFPDFPAADMPAIPAGFGDTSWHNDMCPSFTSDQVGLTIWVDFANPEQREYPEWPRYRVTPQEAGVEVSGESLETNDWSEVEAFVATRTLARES